MPVPKIQVIKTIFALQEGNFSCLSVCVFKRVYTRGKIELYPEEMEKTQTT